MHPVAPSSSLSAEARKWSRTFSLVHCPVTLHFDCCIRFRPTMSSWHSFLQNTRRGLRGETSPLNTTAGSIADTLRQRRGPDHKIP
ncbi:hypothetical protein BFJ63_vAg13479 [Fusarium oxysporum f. sp. narcissi]|uniref:Uncharacterized protein n=1 Tax=Fusarium oxysporum f. sp. narcissi TaxID=451672 RepID=A0A4Q2VEH0_FUSOX|nr:hypothetical protein BFJ63_vAg13479 [Fusarium oxysporum f. sp. narcissi]